MNWNWLEIYLNMLKSANKCFYFFLSKRKSKNKTFFFFQNLTTILMSLTQQYIFQEFKKVKDNCKIKEKQ